MKWKWVLLVALVAAAGCDSGGTGDDRCGEEGCGGSGGGAGGTGGAGGSGGEGGGAGGTGGGTACGPADEPGELPPDGADTGWTATLPESFACPMLEVERPESCGDEFAWWSAVRGWAVAPGGHPLGDARAQLCVHTADKRFVCLRPEEANAEGVYTIEPADEFRCIEKAAMRVLSPRSGRATIYCAIDLEQGPTVTIPDPAVLPKLTPAVELPPEGDPEVWREVVFDDGLVVDWKPSLFYSGGAGSYAEVAARRIPTDAIGLCGEAPTFDGLYAFYPEATVDAPGFGLSIPNVDEYPAGTKVELFVLGSIDCRLHNGTTVPEATWAKFGEATVSEDGAAIVADEGSGLPCLTWLAYRSKE